MLGPGSVRRDLQRQWRNACTSLVQGAWAWAGRVGAIGPDHPRAARFGSFGPGSYIAFPPGTSYNERYIRLGSGVMIGPAVSLSVGIAPGQVMVTDPVLAIGDRTLIGRGSHIVAHFSVDIGADVQTGPYVYITDQNHRYEDPVVPIGQQWPEDAPVSIGDGSWLGTGVVVLPGTAIGKHVVVGAGSVVTGPIPDHCVAVGAPARVVRRWTAADGWQAVRTATPEGRSADGEPRRPDQRRLGADPAAGSS